VIVPISFGIKYEGITKREHNKIMRLLMRNMMTEHVTKTLPKHFEQTRPGGKYKIKRRTKAYIQKKQRRKGHSKMLVWSGKLKRKALMTAKNTVRATKTRSTSRPTGTRVKYKDSTRPLLSFVPFVKQEIEIIPISEVKRYARDMEKQYTRLAKRLKKVKQIRRAKRGA